jgi:SRSO17 transposase
MQQIAEALPKVDRQNLQYLLSEAVWDHREVQRQVGRDADVLLGGHEDSLLILDESGFSKKGEHSAGVGRQWNGRLGKVDNCQVGVFLGLCRGIGVALISAQLYLPKTWTSDVKRCAKAHIPDDARAFKTKSAIGLEMIQSARTDGVRFSWVCADAGYGKEPQFLRCLDAIGVRFMVDVHSKQRIYLSDPEPRVPLQTQPSGRKPSRLTTAVTDQRVDVWMRSQPKSAWQPVEVRHATLGPIRVEALRQRVWLWDKEEPKANSWTLLIVRNQDDHADIHYALTNAPADTALINLVRIERQRYWIEHAFGEAKSEFGLAHYEVRTWLGWHRHITLCMMAGLFALGERIRQADAIPLLSTRDLRTILAELIIRPAVDPEAAYETITGRQMQRWESIRRRYEKIGIQPIYANFSISTM